MTNQLIKTLLILVLKFFSLNVSCTVVNGEFLAGTFFYQRVCLATETCRTFRYQKFPIDMHYFFDPKKKPFLILTKIEYGMTIELEQSKNKMGYSSFHTDLSCDCPQCIMA